MGQQFIQDPGRIIRFLRKEKVLTLATSDRHTPWCANVFYACSKDGLSLIFQSEPATRHILEGMANTKVAGTIYKNRGRVGTIRGVQFTGLLIKPRGQELDSAERIYIKRYPYAKLHPGETYIIQLDYLKMTDNTLGFGTKIIWKR